MDKMFEGKRALVTGGGRGIGREIAELLHKGGAKTFVIDKSAASLKILHEEEQEIEVIEADIADWNQAREAVKSVLPIDLLVNNAGVGLFRPFLECKLSDIDDLFSVHYKAAFNISQTVAGDMVKRNKPGSIVSVSSASTMRHYPGFVVYGTSNAALDSLTKYMAIELGPKQIRVNAVNPTLITTELFKPLYENPERRAHITRGIPLGRLGEKREVADAVVFLLSNKASLINGVTLRLDGGEAL